MELERARVRAEAELRIHKHYRCAPLALPAEDLTAFAPAASRSRFEAAMLSGTIQVSTPSQVTRSSPAADCNGLVIANGAGDMHSQDLPFVTDEACP